MIEKLVKPISENEIKKHWIYKDKCYISCVCLTFNHKDYIRETIDGFLAQETEYRFEIVIHDDASTDGTQDILIEYKNRYPEIIKLVLQEKNRYSQGERILPLVVKYINGEYMAICEGDDFWIDKEKIQKQICIMKDLDVGFCYHDSYIINNDGVVIRDFYKRKRKEGIIDYKRIFTESGQFSPTASMFFKRDLYISEIKEFKSTVVGDFFLEVILGKHGIYFIDEKMSSYRYSENNNSWSSLNLSSINKKIKFQKKFIEQLKEYGQYWHINNYMNMKISLVYLELAKLYKIKKKHKMVKYYYFKSIKHRRIYKVDFSFFVYFLLKR